MTLLLIGVGGFLGAIGRYLVDTYISARIATAFPLGTFVINVSGAFVLGLLYALAVERDILPAGIREPILIGLIGAYTTFSTFMLEAWRLAGSGAVGLALSYLVGSVASGIIAVMAGLMLGRVA